MPVAATIFAVLSCLFAYYLQKNCKKGTVKILGKQLALPKKTVIAGICAVYVSNNSYYARCIIHDTGEVVDIKIDKAMMAAIPDRTTKSKYDVLIEVLVYAQETKNGIEYTLTPEEIRFKLDLKVNQQEGQTYEQLEMAKERVSFLYEIRLIFMTIAIIGIYRSPRISMMLSMASMFISWKNIIPLRFQFKKESGIINIEENDIQNTSQSAGHSDATPPGFERWSNERKYMYQINKDMTRRLKEKQTANSNEFDIEPYYDKESENEESYLTEKDSFEVEYEEQDENYENEIDGKSTEFVPAEQEPKKAIAAEITSNHPNKSDIEPKPNADRKQNTGKMVSKKKKSDEIQSSGTLSNAKPPQNEQMELFEYTEGLMDEHKDEDPFGDSSDYIPNIEGDELDDGFGMEDAEDIFDNIYDNSVTNDEDADESKSEIQSQDTPKKNQFGKKGTGGRRSFSNVYNGILNE